MSCIEPRAAEDGLSQGDVIRWGTQEDCMLKAGIVVTADCDLAKGKHWGKVTVVPLISATEYFDQFYLPKQLEKLEPDLLKLFTSVIGRTSSKSENTESPSPEVVEQLLGMATLPEPFSTSSSATAAHSVIRKARGLVEIESSTQTLNQAAALKDKSNKNFSQTKIKDFLNNTPGDCMILPEISGLQSGIHIAYLRIMREVTERDIALKTSETSNEKGQRIGCLIPVVRYRLTQMLAQVFSDIGLPDEYESGLKNERNKFFEELTKPKGDKQ